VVCAQVQPPDKPRGSELHSNHTWRMVSSVAGTADISVADSLVDKPQRDGHPLVVL
jgi:hypothetical protein